MDVAGGAGAGAAALRLDPGNAVLDRRLHDGRSDLALDRAGSAFVIDKGDVRHATSDDVLGRDPMQEGSDAGALYSVFPRRGNRFTRKTRARASARDVAARL